MMKKTTVLRTMRLAALLACCCTAARAAAPARSTDAAVKSNSLRDAYYGDLHLHTSYSFDAYFDAATKIDPNEAYRFAKGQVVDF